MARPLYEAIGYFTDHYDKAHEFRAASTDMWEVMAKVKEFLDSGPHRKVEIYCHEQRRFFRGRGWGKRFRRHVQTMERQVT